MPRHTLTVLDVSPPRVSVRFEPLSYQPDEDGILIEETESTALQVLIEGWPLDGPRREGHPRAEFLERWRAWYRPDDGEDEWGQLCDIAPDIIEDVELHEEDVDGEPTARLDFVVSDPELLGHLEAGLTWESAILFLEDAVDDD